MGGEGAGLLPPITGVADSRQMPGIDHSTSSVLGLRIPQGMAPGVGPFRVYRFEGPWPVEQVSQFVRDQIRTLWETREGSGYLFREARVKNPADGVDGSQKLSIRVFKGRKSGATVDVWIDSAHWAGKKDGASSGANVGMTAAQRTRRQADKEETMRVWRKIAAGEEPDERDRRSSFFK